MVYVSCESECEGICQVSAVGGRAWGSVQSAEQDDSVVVRVSASCCGVTGGSNTLPKAVGGPKMSMCSSCVGCLARVEALTLNPWLDSEVRCPVMSD